MAKSKFKKVEESYDSDEKYVQPLSKDNLTDEMFDALDVQDDTLPIDKIVPDETQPRTVIPLQFLNVLESGYGAVIAAWEEYVFDAADDFPTVKILEGKESAADYVNDDPLVMEFAEMVSFAANIHDVGLNHPIGVVTRGNLYRIIYGERRWTAFQFLHHYLGGWDKIPAKVANVSEYELAKMQASENSNRPELNAIAKARMFAKLLILARQEGGEKYDSWQQLVVPGGPNRAWYAQVANGDIHRIPRGLGPQFEQALGISVAQMRQYRNLLRLTEDHNINDAIWQLGNAGDWSENFMREVGQYLEPSIIRQILDATDGYTVTTVTVSRSEEVLREAVDTAKRAAELAKKQAERDAPQTPPPAPPHGAALVERGADTVDKSGWASVQWVGKTAYAGSLKVEVVEAVGPQLVTVKTDDGEAVEVHVNALRPYDGAESPFNVDDRVHVAGIGPGVIRYVKDGKYGVYLDSSGSTHYYPAAQLSALTPNPSPSGRGEQDSDNADTPNGDGLVPENWVGKAVKSPVNGEIGLVTTDDGDYVRVKWSRGYYSNHQKDALTVVNYQLWIDSVKPKDWTGLYVQTVVGAVAGVVKDNGAAVDIIFPDKHQVSQQKQFLSLVDKREWDEAVERHKNGITPDNPPPQPSPKHQGGSETGLEKSAYHGLSAAQLVTKRVVYQGKPAIVVGNHGSEDVMLALGDGGRVRVHVSQVALDDGSNGQRLADVMTQPSPPTPLPQVEGSDDEDETLIAEFTTDYDLISAVRLCAQELGNKEAQAAFTQLLDETEPDVNPGKLGLLLDECFAHTKEIMAAMEQRVGQRFAAILKAAGDGTD